MCAYIMIIIMINIFECIVCVCVCVCVYMTGGGGGGGGSVVSDHFGLKFLRIESVLLPYLCECSLSCSNDDHLFSILSTSAS